MADHTPSDVDHVGRILEQWAVERPDLDVTPMGVIGRVHRIAHLLDEQLRPVFADAGLGEGDFDVLATLRRAGSPYELTPGELAGSTMVTSGAVTKRVDRLERGGWVTREICGDDGRSRRIRLTDSGRELADRLVEQHVANEHRLVAGLTAEQRASLAALLVAWGGHLGA